MGFETPHFKQSEFERYEPLPDECLEIYYYIAVWILEPTRSRFPTPVEITSAMRSLERNTAAHGQMNSEHLQSPTHGAVDFKMATFCGDMRPVFDWMRLNPELPFHQLILEHTDTGETIIHVSVNKLMPGIRSCKEGHTNNKTQYTNVFCVPYKPQSAPATEGAT